MKIPLLLRPISSEPIMLVLNSWYATINDVVVSETTPYSEKRKAMFDSVNYLSIEGKVDYVADLLELYSGKKWADTSVEISLIPFAVLATVTPPSSGFLMSAWSKDTEVSLRIEMRGTPTLQKFSAQFVHKLNVYNELHSSTAPLAVPKIEASVLGVASQIVSDRQKSILNFNTADLQKSDALQLAATKPPVKQCCPQCGYVL